MATPTFDRTRLRLKTLAQRQHLLGIKQIAVSPEGMPSLPEDLQAPLARLATRIVRARITDHRPACRFSLRGPS